MRMIHISVGIAISLAPAPPEPLLAPAETVAIHGGNVSFSVSTNTLGINVQGTSDALEGRVELRHDAEGLMLDRVTAWLPVKTLHTGMTLRDSHMRKYVFEKPSGETPDLRFEAEGVSCAGVAPGREVNCQLAGTLAIRDLARNLSVSLKVRQEGSSAAFRVRGDGSVKLSDYAIEPPSQLGVKTANEVQIRLDFTAKPAVSAPARAGAVR
jgi:polyisoprenoid-binding protein YceI